MLIWTSGDLVGTAGVLGNQATSKKLLEIFRRKFKTFSVVCGVEGCWSFSSLAAAMKELSLPADRKSGKFLAITGFTHTVEVPSTAAKV